MQTPQRRAHVSQETERRTRRILLGVAALGFVGLAAAAGLFLFGGGGSDARAAIRGAGCTLREVPAVRQTNHVEQMPKRSVYNTWPPTSGPQSPEPAPYDFYTEPVEQHRILHDLEHGGVAIQYGAKVADAEVEKIRGWYQDDPNGIVIAPLPDLGASIALTAWTTPEGGAGERGTGVLVKCPRFDGDVFDTFLDTYGFRGPERAPRDALTPGS